jgi:hypothetical protein
MRCNLPAVLVTAAVLAMLDQPLHAAAAAEYRSHPPARVLPRPSDRPLAQGPSFFVDPRKGDDRNDGSREKPWRSLQHAVQKLRPGDTVYLRGGTCYEHVTVTCAGTPEKPITIRAHPGELAVLDGGLREFFENPDSAWEPCPGGVAGEYRSTKTYPDLGAAGGVNVYGRFGDSLVPMQAYRFLRDLRDPSMTWDVTGKVDDTEGVYCGPGIFYDVPTGRIHARLAHTDLKALGTDNYRGETDPRKLPLVIAGLKHGPVLAVRGARDVHFQDLVVRGSATAAVEVTDAARLRFEGLTVYGGHSAFLVRDTAGLRILHTACRGIAAPWTFRGHLKYRSTEARIFSASGWNPTGADNRDFELAYSEFTDSVDGVFIGSVRGVHFHHNLLDNVSDDGIFLTSGTAYDGTTPGGEVYIYQNVLARCLTTFAFGVGHGRQKTTPTGKQTGAGVYIFRNVFDYRRPVLYQFPADPATTAEIPSRGRFASDHGSPAWEPMTIYHNTIIADDPATNYFYGTAGLGNSIGKGSYRRVFNNIVLQCRVLPGTFFPPAGTDLHADGNLFWSIAKGPEVTGDPFAKFRQSAAFTDSKTRYAPGWGAGDRFVDPKFLKVDGDWKTALDLRLGEGSPALDAGLALSANWPDPLRAADRGKPDLGALPLGGEPWCVGIQGRLTMFGAESEPQAGLAAAPRAFVPDARITERAGKKPAALVEGYPEFDAPVLQYLLKKQGVRVDHHLRTWLDPKEYHAYRLVILGGDLQRAGIEHNKFTPADLLEVRKFLDNGGVLLLLRRGKRAFEGTPEGREFLKSLTGQAEPEKDLTMAIKEPTHPWVKHLDPNEPHPWLVWPRDQDNPPLRPTRGERIICSPAGSCMLYRVPVGKGQLVYVGWHIVAHSLPSGQEPVEKELLKEKAFAEQVQILHNLLADLYAEPAAR